MIALAPPATEQCVDASSSAAQQAKAVYEISGPASDVAGVLKVMNLAHWTIVSDTTHDDLRKVRLLMKPDTPYREIGGFIYTAQTKHLTITSGFEPPICGTDKK